MIRPQLDAPQVTIAEEQEEYLPITAALVRNRHYSTVGSSGFNTVLVAFRLTDEERARIAAGEDLYIGLLTFMRPMQGINVMVGKEEASAAYGVPLEAPDNNEEDKAK